MTAPEVARPGGVDRRWQALAEKIAPGASRLDLDYLGEVCQRLGLSPFTSPPQVVLIGRYDNRVGRAVYRPQVTVDGRLALAVRSGRVVGLEGPQFTGPRDRWTDDGGRRVWVEAWDCKDEGEYPRAARYLIHLAGWVCPVNGTAPWLEFAQRGKDGGLADLWKRMPTTMLGKAALSLGLRRSGVESMPADIAVAYEGDGDTGDTGDGEVVAVEERPPPEVYDSLPESRGDLPAADQPTSYDPPGDDPGRPFEEG